MSKLKKGVNECSNAEYHADRHYISSSGLKKMLYNPQDFYRAYVLNEPQPHRTAFDVGTYVHTAILEPHLLEEECAVYEGIRRGKDWEIFKTDNAGKAIITDRELIKIERWLEAYKQDELATSLVTGGKPELTVCTELDECPVKVRCDYYHDNYILDVKTTSAYLNKENITSVCFAFDYDLSAALYLDAFNKEMGTNIERFIFLFIGKNDDKIYIMEASKEFLENGRKKYKKAIDKLKLARYTESYGFEEIGVPDEHKF